MRSMKKYNGLLAAGFAAAMLLASFVFPGTSSAADTSSMTGTDGSFIESITPTADYAAFGMFSGMQGWRYVRCNSSNNRYNQCGIGGNNGGVMLYKRHSHSGCVRGQDWGVRGGMIWVDNGCQATFRVGGGRWGGGRRNNRWPRY